MHTERTDYWDKFYAGADLSQPIYPSQFAAFVLGEVPEVARIIELGCGNGRDTEFFASYGIDVVAVDASESAIDFCRSRRRYENIRLARFALGDDNINKIVDEMRPRGKTVLYARFFLHAITGQEETAFFSIARDVLKSGDVLALEYRCAGDEQIQKEFGQHYRRYIHHDYICRLVSSSGFDISYQVEGKGFAKYKSEDALVGRCIASRSQG